MNKKNYRRCKNLKSTSNKSVIRALKGISLIAVILVIVVISQTSIYSISASAPNRVETEQQFNLNATYAYVGKGNPNDTVTDHQGILMSPISQYPSAVYINVTRPTVENVECDAILEVFNVTITSDKGPAEHFVFFTGTNYNPSFSEDELNILTKGIYTLIDVETIDGVSGMFCPNWTDNESFLSPKVGSFGTYTNYKNDLGLWSEGKPNTISVTISRIGYVTMTNGRVSSKLVAESVTNRKQVQLQEYGDGFLKNELVPTDKISQENKFQPLKQR